jgi:argininosuccinate synthase
VTARIVFAWSGAAEAWPAIAAMAAEQGAEIVTLTLDLGQRDDLEEVRDRALASGAVRAHVLDVREELARDYVLPALQANALQHDPMARRLALQLVSTKLEEIAGIEGATPAVDSVAIEDTLLGREGATYTLTKAPADAPQIPAHVEIAFERGVPTAINGVPMALTELIEILTIIAGHHGVGRIGDVEAPAAVVLSAAYAALAAACHRDAVTGAVRIELLQGNHTVTQIHAGSRIPDPGSGVIVPPS